LAGTPTEAKDSFLMRAIDVSRCAKDNIYIEVDWAMIVAASILTHEDLNRSNLCWKSRKQQYERYTHSHDIGHTSAYIHILSTYIHVYNRPSLTYTHTPTYKQTHSLTHTHAHTTGDSFMHTILSFANRLNLFVQTDIYNLTSHTCTHVGQRLWVDTFKGCNINTRLHYLRAHTNAHIQYSHGVYKYFSGFSGLSGAK